MARSIEVNGVTVSVDSDKGGLIVYGKKEDLGKTVTMRGSYSSTASGAEVHANFVEYNGKVVAIMPQMKPGNYWSASGVGDVTVVPDYVVQATKRS